ncbi:MAG: tyrosine-type recombinase/integrase [Symploca sp. SIO1B1]|nr:tyrosine-type recombinase/integrase [Symploca sp. SIO1B1]
MWLHGKPDNTIRKYTIWVERFLESVDYKPLHLVTLEELQHWQSSLERYSPNTQRNALASIKSLFTFGHELGVLPFNVARIVKPPKAKDTLGERILTEVQVQKMIAMEPNPRNEAILRLLYYGCLRVSELVYLTWNDLSERGDEVIITIFGKGGITRVMELPAPVWKLLCQLRQGAAGDAPVFRSRKHSHDGRLDPSRVNRIVRDAAVRAGIGKNVSPHWFRHSHASHSLDRGCPPHLVRDGLGHKSLSTTSRYLKARPKDSSSRYLPL